jgi:hypothetical protein
MRNGSHCEPFYENLQSEDCKGLDRRSLLDQTGGDPILGLGDRPAFRNLDDVTQLVLALFVVCMVLAGFADDLAVKLVLNPALDQYRHRLGALVADHLANQGTLEGFFSFRHL